ncbi:MAG TPA: hypothetical protein DCK95_01810, partial [Anaerolineaceae bacterium]|nr:hypothetical protein [Anaerolineaceae bacterium]
MKDFRIKGIGDVLLVQMEEGDWDGELKALLTYIETRGDFFKSAKIAIDVGERKVKAVQMADLRDGLAERQVNLVALFAKSKQTVATARTFGLETEPENIRTLANSKKQESLYGGENAILYSHTLRAGMKGKYPGGGVVVGGVNTGGGVLADGNVVIWGGGGGGGAAGAKGGKKAVI